MKLAKIDNIVVDVLLSEQMIESSEVTEYPVEQGGNVTDHVKNEPLTINIEGVFTEKDSWRKVQELRKLKRDRKTFTFIGRNISRNLVISQLETDHLTTNKFGANFTATFQQVKIPKGKRFGESVEGIKMQTQTSKRVHQGRQQVAIK